MSKAPAEIEQEIEQTRAAMADTVASLSERADVKARAHEKAEEIKQEAARRNVVPIALGAAAVLTLVWFLRRY